MAVDRHIADIASELADVVYVLRTEPDMAFEFVSPSVEALVGYTPQEHYDDPELGRKILDPRDLDVLTRAAKSAEGQPVDFTVRWLSKDGRTVWTHHLCRTIRRDDGSVAIYGAARDVTDHHEALEALPDPFFTFAAVRDDAGEVVDLEYTYLNPPAERLYRRPAAEVIGHRLLELFPSTAELGIFDCYVQPLHTGEPSTMEVESFDENGVGGAFDVAAAPFGDGVIVTARDVSDRQEARQLVLETELKYRRMAESTSDVVVAANPVGLITWCSPSVEPLLGWTPGELVGASVFEFLHPDDLPSVVTGQAGLDGGEARTFEARVRQSDAGYRWIAARVRPVLGDDGRVHELVAGWRDIHDEHVAREALAASEQQYRLLAENASDVVYRTDLQARCVWISPSVKTTLGWEPNELLGRAMVELVHPDDLAEAERLRKAAEDAGVEPEHQQRRYLTADGRWRWMLVVTRALHGEDGTPVGGVAALRDVHEQVLAQQAVEASRRRTQALFEGHASVMLVVEPATGTIVAANAAAARFYGYPQTVLAGMAIDEINILPADEVAARRAAALAGEHNSFLFPHRLADGHIRTVEVHSSPIKDGERTLLFSIIRDVTDEVAAHGALTAAKERYRQLALNATDVVFHTDREGVFEWVSESVREVVGWTPEELVGTPAAALAHPDDVTALVDTATRVAAGERVDYRARYRTADGGYRWLDVAARPVLDGDGEVVGRIGAGRDVTDEVELQAALAASEALYRGVTVALHEGIVVHARDGRIVQANARAQEILGLSVEQMMGRTSTDPPWRAVHEDGSPFPGGTHPAMVTLATGTPTRDVVMGVHKPDGTLTWTLVNAEPLPGLPGDGHGPGVVASFTDITGLRLAQHAVREQREHLQATLDSLLDPHAAWEPVRDEQGAVVDFLCLDMNRAALADQDVTRDQIVGRGLMEVFPGSSGAGMFEQFRQVAETGVPWSVDDFPYDNELVGPQRRYDMHAILVGTELRVTWRDVTDQVEAAEQLAKSRLEYRLLAENAADVVLRLDEKGRTAWISPAVQRLLGYPPQEMLGETRFDLVHPGDESGVREALERLTAGIDETVTVELRLRHRHGGYVWWEATGRFVDDHGGGRQVVVAFRDVDERVHAARTAQAEQERRQAVVDSMLDPLLLLGPVRDLQGHVVDLVIHDINNAACDLFGRPRSAVVGTALSALFDGPAVPVVIGWCRGVLATGTPLALDGAELVSDLTHDARWYDVRAVRVEDSVSLTWRDVTEAHQARDAIERQARMDALTGLANRREALTRLEQMLGHDPRTGHRIAVAFCDLDDFKTINDEHGHGAGDEALQVVAARVAALVRDNDLVARIGGDEILVVLDGVRDLADAQSLAEKIRQVARLPIPVLGGTFDITLSVGVTLAKTNEDVDALIARADRAMYEAKNTGKDRVVSL